MRQLAAIGLLTLAAPAWAAGEEPPPDTLLLFVAAWCAPCHAELRRIEAIVAAAAPARVRVVPYDRGRRTEAMLRGLAPALVWHPEPQALRRLLADARGLPFAILTDSEARICARSQRGLDAAETRAMVERCAAR